MRDNAWSFASHHRHRVRYMVLASQFNSLLHPITVLTILPLSIAGAMAALWLTGRTLNVFSMIGC